MRKEKTPICTLSLIGTVFNNGNVVEDSLRSLITGLRNVLDHYEIVIVDNFSTDSTYEKVVQLSKIHPEIKVYREHCSRGAGRQTALQKSSGKYVMPVDFDSIYSQEFFRLVDYLLRRNMKENEVVDGFTSRDNLIKIGGWRNLNSSEDTEICSRAIFLGYKWFRTPLLLVENQPGKMREKRYSKNFTSYIRRLVQNRTDKICSLGITEFAQVHAKSFLERVFEYLVLVKSSVRQEKAHSYIESPYNNWDYVGLNSAFLDPRETGIDKELWGYLVYKHLFRPEVLQAQIDALKKLGLDRIYEFNSGLLVITTDNVSKNRIRQAEQLLK